MIEHELARLRSGETELLTKVADQVAQIWPDGRSPSGRPPAIRRIARQGKGGVRATARKASGSAESQRLAAATDEITRALAGLMKIEGMPASSFHPPVSSRRRSPTALRVSEKIASLEAAVDAAVKAAERNPECVIRTGHRAAVSPMPGADAPVGDRPEPTACAVETPPSAGAESVPVSARRRL